MTLVDLLQLGNVGIVALPLCFVIAAIVDAIMKTNEDRYKH
jgi:hypothetical protein